MSEEERRLPENIVSHGGRPHEQLLIQNPDGSQQTARYAGELETEPGFPMTNEDRARMNLERQIYNLERKLGHPHRDLSRMTNQQLLTLDDRLYELAVERGRQLQAEQEAEEERRQSEEMAEQEAAYYGYN